VVLSFLALSLSLSLYFLGDGMEGGNIVVLVKAGWMDRWMDGWTKWMTVAAAALFAFHGGWHGFLPVSRGKALPARGVYEWMEWMYGRE
jgi:hypothetical protein